MAYWNMIRSTFGRSRLDVSDFQPEGLMGAARSDTMGYTHSCSVSGLQPVLPIGDAHCWDVTDFQSDVV